MTLSDVVRYDIHSTDLQDYFRFGHAEVVKRFAEAGVVPAGGIPTAVPALSIPGMAVEITSSPARERCPVEVRRPARPERARRCHGLASEAARPTR